MALWTRWLLVFAIVAASCARAPEPAPRIKVGGVTRDERCLTCHANTVGVGDAHAPREVGCSPCHLGDPRAMREETAHVGLVRIPGQLDRVLETCGQAGCHPAEAARVIKSPMAGAPGILAIDKFAFGERAEPVVRAEDDLRTLKAKASSPAEDHVRKLCGSCHLAAPKHEPGDQGFFARGGGCTACHLGAPVGTSRASQVVHASVTSDVSEHRCEGCHARSGRISLSYRGVAEVEPAQATSHLPDGRPVTNTASDVHARAGMTCIDCHTERDVMGDGSSHAYAREAVEIRCQDCHASELRSAGVARDAADVAQILIASWKRRGMPSLTGRHPIITQRGTPLYRSDVPSRTLMLATKGDLRTMGAAKPNAYHTLSAHERLTCQACHSAWAPRCTQCHTTFAPEAKGFDHLQERETSGAWHEQAGGNGFGPPALMVEANGKIGPFVEGMTLRISGVGEETKSRELWAPLDPHTTGPAHACASCHPGEASIYPAKGEVTRVGARVLNGTERERIARVAKCISCHGKYEDPVYVDFEKSVERLRRRALAKRADGVRRCKGGVVGEGGG